MATGFLSFLSCRNDAIIILSLHGVNEFLHIYAFYVIIIALYLHFYNHLCISLFYASNIFILFFVLRENLLDLISKIFVDKKRKAPFSRERVRYFSCIFLIDFN